ncbi:phage tail tip lysozyme, partial [Micromonospora sp. MW-13]|uniref:phage tail tip lysozyme n=4 Tax=unclassified Micromonospora TaxID=2617518 RepID=UPI001A9D4312
MAGDGFSRRTFLHATVAAGAVTAATLGTVWVGSGPALAADNSRAAWDFFVAKGLTAEQAAGVLGNLAQESNINPQAQEPGGPGRGIAQWSTGGRWDTTPSANAMWYAASTGQSVWSLQAQLGFIWWELTNIPAYGLAELRSATTIADATVAFQNRYERCGTCHQATRISYATGYYNQYAG